MADRRRTDKRKYEVQNIQERHREIIRQIIIGRKNVEIAAVMGCTAQNVSDVRNSEICKSMLSLMQDAADESVINVEHRFKEISPKAVNEIEGVLDSETAKDSDKIAAAREILDRAGYSPVRRVQSAHAHLTVEDLEVLKNRANGSGMVVKADPTLEEAEYEVEDVSTADEEDEGDAEEGNGFKPFNTSPNDPVEHSSSAGHTD